RAAGGGSVMAFGEQNQLSVGAVSDPDGSNPRGEVTVTTNATLAGTMQTNFHGDVSRGCLLVTGNQATAVGELPESEQFEVPGVGTVRFLAVTVVDNGHPQAGEPVDLASAILLFEQTEVRVCAGLRTLPVFPLTHGN